MKLPVKWGAGIGALLGCTVVSIGIIRYTTGMIYRDDHSLSLVYWCIFTLTVCVTVLRLKKQQPSTFHYLHAITVGVLAGLVSGSLYTLYSVILNNFIDPELPGKLAQMVDQARAGQTEDSGSFKPMEMSSALRGFLYVLVCMGFGFVHSSIAFFGYRLLKRLRNGKAETSQQ